MGGMLMQAAAIVLALAAIGWIDAGGDSTCAARLAADVDGAWVTASSRQPASGCLIYAAATTGHSDDWRKLRLGIFVLARLAEPCCFWHFICAASRCRFRS